MIKFMPSYYNNLRIISVDWYNIPEHIRSYSINNKFYDFLVDKHLCMDSKKFHIEVDMSWTVLPWFYYCRYSDFNYQYIYKKFIEEIDTLSDYYKDMIIYRLLNEISINDINEFAEFPINKTVISDIYNSISDMEEYQRNLVNCICYPIISNYYIIDIVQSINRSFIKDLLTDPQRDKLFNELLLSIATSDNYMSILEAIYNSMIILFSIFSDALLEPKTHDALKKMLFDFELKRKMPNVQLLMIKLLASKLSLTNEEQQKLLKLESRKVIKTL